MLDRAHAALVNRAERDGAFRARCEEAAARFLAMRRRVPPRPKDRATIEAIVGGAEARAIAAELA